MEEQRFRPKEVVRKFDGYDKPAKSGAPSGGKLAALAGLAAAMLVGGVVMYNLREVVLSEQAPEPADELAREPLPEPQEGTTAAVDRDSVNAAVARKIQDALAKLDGMGGGKGDRQMDSALAVARTRLQEAVDRSSTSGRRRASKPRGHNRSRAQILQVLRRKTPQVQAVYEARLKQVPEFSGRVTMTFSVVSSGRVVDARVASSTTRDRLFDEAVLDKVRSWVFPAMEQPDDTTAVTWPFHFRPK